MFKITKMGHLPTLEQILRKPSDPAKEPRQTSSDPPPRSGVVVTNDESPTMMALYSTKWAYSAMMYIYIYVFFGIVIIYNCVSMVIGVLSPFIIAKGHNYRLAND